MFRARRWAKTPLLAALLAAALVTPVRADDRADLKSAFTRAQALHKQGKYAEAQPLYEESLDLAARVFGPDDENTGAVANYLAMVYKARGIYDKALLMYKRALAITEKKYGPDNLKTAVALDNLGLFYQTRIQFSDAEALHKRALQIEEKVPGGDNLDVAITLNNLATVYVNQRQFAKALPFQERALEITEKVRGRDHPDVATALDNLGTLYRSQGQYAKAVPLQERALKIYEKEPGPDHPETGLALKNLAELYRIQRRFDEALPIYQRALRIMEKKAGPDSPAVAHILDELGMLYKEQGQYATAAPYYERAMRILEKTAGPNSAYLADTLFNLAILFDAQGKKAEALPLYERTLRIREAAFGPDNLDVAHVLGNLSLLYAAQGSWEKAVEARGRERRIVHRYFSQELPFLAEAEQLAFLRKNDYLLSAIFLGWDRRADPAVASRSVEWLINGYGVAHEALALRARLTRDSADPALAPVVRQLQEARQRQAAFALTTPRRGQEQQRAADLREMDTQIRELEKQLVAGGGAAPAQPWVDVDELRRALSRDDLFVGLGRVQPFDWTTRDSRPDRYAAWVVPPAGAGDVKIVDLGPADAIDAAVQAARESIAKAADQGGDLLKLGEPKAEQAARVALDALAKLVLHPIVEAAGGRTKWFLSPDGQLWLAPWSALPMIDGKYAIESLTLTLLVSGRELVASPPKSHAEGEPPVIFADPDFDLGAAGVQSQVKDLTHGGATISTALRGLSNDGSRLPQVKRLHGTATEAAAIRPALQKLDRRELRIYEDKQALEEAAKAMKGPRVVVFSTHGFFLPDQEVETSDRLLSSGEKTGPVKVKGGGTLENPLLRCGLLLAGCNHRSELAAAGAEDGVLTGLEVCGLDLRGADLVVLSACETGIGDVRKGEGVAGLRQAFQLAGARAVLASLWQVEDLSTAQLMTAFFDGLANKKNKAEALRDAQIAMIKQRREKHNAAHPFFWAAFTLTGQ